VAAGLAFEVVEYPGIDFLTHAGTGQAADGATGQPAQNCACYATEYGANGTRNGAQRGATLGTSDRAGGTSRCATERSGCAAHFAGEIADANALRITGRAVNRHFSDSCSTERAEEGYTCPSSLE